MDLFEQQQQQQQQKFYDTFLLVGIALSITIFLIRLVTINEVFFYYLIFFNFFSASYLLSKSKNSKLNKVGLIFFCSSMYLSVSLMYFFSAGKSHTTALWLIALPLLYSFFLKIHVTRSLSIISALIFLLVFIINNYLGISIEIIHLASPSYYFGIHASLLIFLIYYGVTNFNSAQEQLYKSKHELLSQKTINSQKDTFLSNMSHELRTPLNGIYGALQLVKGETDAEKSLLKAAKHSAEALNRIVSDILDLQKLEAGKLIITNEWFQVKGLFEQVRYLHSALAEIKGVALNVHIEPNIPYELSGDELRLQQVINNLVSNAVKFTAEGSVTVHARYEDNKLSINVSDTGIGMDDAALSHLFDRFIQADASITKKYAGTGLGMAISKDLVELMGGTISVSSTPNKGTTFTVTLPLEGRQQIAQAVTPTTQPKLSKDLRILFVDDLATNTLVGQALLADHFDNVDTAHSGSEALAKLNDSSYDLLITDIGMPGMSGEELHDAVKAEIPHLPVIALTGNASKADRDKYLGMGFDGVATKPFQLENLLALISDIFEAKKIV